MRRFGSCWTGRNKVKNFSERQNIINDIEFREEVGRMEHYITEIAIKELRHLSNIVVSLNPEKRQHLIITGKNGSGKTSLLLALQKYLSAINENMFRELVEQYIPSLSVMERQLNAAKTETEKQSVRERYKAVLNVTEQYTGGVRISFSEYKELDSLYRQGEFITAYYAANRKTKIVRAKVAEDIKLALFYKVDSEPGELLHKYLVHLKTQQAYARNEGDLVIVDRIQAWFDRFVDALRILLDDDTVTLEYDYKEYDFKIHESGRIPFGFDELSDGYSSVIHIVSDLILRMDKNWLLRDTISQYDIEGIVLIDEVETHLHIELQKKIMPFLTRFFPRIQFIITTHSPYILNSISNAKVYDLERCIELEDLSVYSADGLAEGFFEADEYADELKDKIDRYQELKCKMDLTEEESAERAKLRSALKNIPQGLSREAADKFLAIEGKSL